MNKTKVCYRCKVEKPLDEFLSDKKAKDGRKGLCKKCHTKEILDYKKTKRGLITAIYSAQRSNSRSRKHPMPDYTLDELYDWMLSQPHFEELYNNWVESGYDKSIRPSIDRLDDYKPYTFSNIQLMTWRENNKKYKAVPIKSYKAVNVYTLFGEYLDTFKSIRTIANILETSESHISQVCNNQRHYVKHLVFKFADDNPKEDIKGLITKIEDFKIIQKKPVVLVDENKLFETTKGLDRYLGVYEGATKTYLKRGRKPKALEPYTIRLATLEEAKQYYEETYYKQIKTKIEEYQKSS